ncbi:MAG: hypothetical protein J6R88_00495, partial [Clostridia bacterium]|nr:hypothetical protein [Clostridia bacterium]
VKALFAVNELGAVPEYSIIKRKDGEFTDHLLLNGKTYPIFDWRYDAPTGLVSWYAQVGIGDTCSYKASGAISESVGIDRFLYKELDTAESVLQSKIKHLTAFVNKNACNVILRMQNDKVAVLELGATMPSDAEEQTHHSAWGTKGMVSDRVVSSKIRPQSVYLYNDGKNPTTYNDNNGILYGLSADDCAKASAIAMMLLNKVNYIEWADKHEHLLNCIKAVYKSNELGKRVSVTEVE